MSFIYLYSVTGLPSLRLPNHLIPLLSSFLHSSSSSLLPIPIFPSLAYLSIFRSLSLLARSLPVVVQGLPLLQSSYCTSITLSLTVQPLLPWLPLKTWLSSTSSLYIWAWLPSFVRTQIQQKIFFSQFPLIPHNLIYFLVYCLHCWCLHNLYTFSHDLSNRKKYQSRHLRAHNLKIYSIYNNITQRTAA